MHWGLGEGFGGGWRGRIRLTRPTRRGARSSWKKKNDFTEPVSAQAWKLKSLVENATFKSPFHVSSKLTFERRRVVRGNLAKSGRGDRRWGWKKYVSIRGALVMRVQKRRHISNHCFFLRSISNHTKYCFLRTTRDSRKEGTGDVFPQVPGAFQLLPQGFLCSCSVDERVDSRKFKPESVTCLSFVSVWLKVLSSVETHFADPW